MPSTQLFQSRMFRGILLIMAATTFVKAGIPSFPGAEGFGNQASGGRTGSVYHVTNLEDSGPGSFRDAVSQTNRIVVFDVGGIIPVSSRIIIKKNIYVAGQTAPGGGITLYGNGIALNGDSGNNIIRYIRFRMGKNGDNKKDALAISAGQKYMINHVSISWGIDGTLDVNGSGIDSLSFTDCIIGQGINIINHSTGGLMQSGKWSVIRSLYIDNKTRNPKARGTHEFINSVLYNWASNGYIMGDTEGLSEANLIGNYFIYGPSSSTNSHITGTTAAFHVYAKDNWVDANKNGTLDGSLLTDYKTAAVQSTPYNYPGAQAVLSAQNALNHVIQHVGASRSRDAVDQFLIDELRSYGTKGQIITTEDDNGIAGNVGTVAHGTPPTDSDQDGIPDDWETAHGLNPSNASDGMLSSLSAEGYTNVEMYVNQLAGDPVVFNSSPSSSSSSESSSSSQGVMPCGSTDCSTVLQAEDFCRADGDVESTNTGYSGNGYLNFSNTEGSSVQYMFNSPKDQTVTLYIRYANGGSASRNMSLWVNSLKSTHIVECPATTHWQSWSIVSTPVSLLTGPNQVEFRALTSEGGPNFDSFGFTEPEISYTACNASTLTQTLAPRVHRATDLSIHDLQGRILFQGSTLQAQLPHHGWLIVSQFNEQGHLIQKRLQWNP